MSRSPRNLWCVFCCGLALLTPPLALAQQTLLVHLPSAPVEASNQQAEAITELAAILSQRLPETTVEATIFSRWEDANAYLEGQGDTIALMLSDASYALVAPPEWTPFYRFVREGSESYRRRLVVHRDSQELTSLADLSQKSLAVVETSGTSDAAFLEQQVFEGDLDPRVWFAAPLTPAADDFEATASVLYGQTDAALVAEYNNLLSKHIGEELRVIFDSPPLSLPVLSVRQASLTPVQQQALGLALADLGGDPRGKKVLAGLGIEEIRPFSRGRAALRPTTRPSKPFEIALPTDFDLPLEISPPPTTDQLTFGIAIELPQVPLEAGQE